jgi:HD domain
MVRMSDLVRGLARDTPARPGEPPADPAAVPPADPAAAGPAARPRGAEDDPRVVERAVPRSEPSESVEDPAALLGELQELLLEVRGLTRGGIEFPWARLEAMIERVVASLDSSPDLFWVANNPAVSPGVDYLAFHQARVAVLAVRIAVNAGYDRRRLIALGMAGALIDVGLWQMPETLLRRVDGLAGDELSAYRSHPRVSAEIIQRWGPPNEGIVQAVLEHHEREQGQGFPQGLTGAAVVPEAKILGLAETYTGLTLPPTARPRLRPHEAVRELVKSRHEAFPPTLIKALLSEISVFPPGTVVRLNTEEIGRVVGVNRHHPLRPRVELLADSKGQRLPSPKAVDLSQAPFLYITGPVTEGGR